jgi:plastocyanin
MRRGAILLALALLASACGGDGAEPATEATETTPAASPEATETEATETEEPERVINLSSTGEKANDHGTLQVTDATVDVVLGDYFFEPTVLLGEPGATVTLQLDNQGSILHNFAIDEQAITVDVNDGEQATVDVTFPETGAVMFYCEYHPAQYMRGELSVAFA